MTITKLILLGLFYTGSAFAGEDWLCRQEASQRRGYAILACGMAMAKDEPTARAKAFEAAMEEFHRVCDNSVDCVGHEFQAMPQRTQCETVGSSERCYRLVTVYIGHNYTPVKRLKTIVAQVVEAPKVAVAKAQVIKLKVGMTKARVLAAFGRPYDVMKLDVFETFFYNNSLCAPIDKLCRVGFEEGRLITMNSVDSQYLDFE